MVSFSLMKKGAGDANLSAAADQHKLVHTIEENPETCGRCSSTSHEQEMQARLSEQSDQSFEVQALEATISSTLVALKSK